MLAVSASVSSAPFHPRLCEGPEDLVDSLGLEPLRRAEFERVRNQHLARLTSTYASNLGCARLLATSFIAGRPATDIGALRAETAAVTPADVQRAARRW